MRVWASHRFPLVLGLIAAAGLLGRVAYILVAKRPVDACGRARCGDAVYYVAQARRLADGLGFVDPAHPGMPAADHPPITALVLTPAGAFGPHAVTLGRLTMAVLGTATIVVLGLLGRRIAGALAGLLVAALATVNPNLWMNDALPMSEAPTALVLSLTVLALYRTIDRPDARRLVVLGLLSGLLVLTRAELALYVPLAVAPCLLVGSDVPLPRRLGRVAAVGALAVAVVLPWTVANLTRFDRPVAISTNEGLTWVGANCDAVYTGGGIGFWNLECAKAVDPQLPPDADQSVRSEIYRDVGLTYVGDHTRELPAVVVARVGRLWNLHHPDQMVWLNTGEGRERWASWSGVWAFWLLLPSTVAGAVALRRRRVPVWPLLAPAVIVTLTAALFYGIVRFRLPFDVTMTVLAGVGVDAAWRRLRPTADVVVEGAPLDV